MKRLFIVLLCFVFLFIGCLKAKNPVCEVEEPSTLCMAADQLNLSLDDIATVLKLGNIAGLSTKAYDAQQAYAFIDNCKSFIQSNPNLTYGRFVTELTNRYMGLSPTIQALFILSSAEYELDITGLEKEPLTPYDYYLIILHLDKQKLLVAPFLPVL